MPYFVESFPPISSPNARILILGSMPGLASLSAGQYYAHPHNLFWRITAETLGFPADDTYVNRVEKLNQAGIAVWDVLARCHRPGSLDSAIDISSAEANDLPTFLRAHPLIFRIAFNGAAAEALYRRYILPKLSKQEAHKQLEYIRLPSTSPANASISITAKREAWTKGLLS